MGWLDGVLLRTPVSMSGLIPFIKYKNTFKIIPVYAV